MNAIHRIADLHLDLCFESDDPRPQAMADDDLLALAREHILLTLAETLDREDDGRLRHIEHLDIDLGACAVHDYAAQVPALLTKLLREALARHNSDAAKVGAGAGPARAAAGNRDPLEHFLLTGVVRSTAEDGVSSAAGSASVDSSRPPHERLLARWLAAPAGDELLTLLRRCATSPDPVRRLAQQFDAAMLRQLVLRVESPALAAGWLSLVDDIEAALPLADAMRRQHLRQFWEVLLDGILGARQVSASASGALRMAAAVVAARHAPRLPQVGALLRAVTAEPIVAPGVAILRSVPELSSGPDGQTMRPLQDMADMPPIPPSPRANGMPSLNGMPRHLASSAADRYAYAQHGAGHTDRALTGPATEAARNEISQPAPVHHQETPQAIQARFNQALATSNAATIYADWDTLLRDHATMLRAILRRHGNLDHLAQTFPASLLDDMAALLGETAPVSKAAEAGDILPADAAGSDALWSAIEQQITANAGNGAELMLNAIRSGADNSASRPTFLLRVAEALRENRVIDLDEIEDGIAAASNPLGQNDAAPLALTTPTPSTETSHDSADASRLTSPLSTPAEQTRLLTQALLDADAARVQSVLGRASSQMVIEALHHIGPRTDVWLRISRFAPRLLMQLTAAAAPQAANVLLTLYGADRQMSETSAGAVAAGTVPDDPVLWQRCLNYLASTPFEAGAFRNAVRVTAPTDHDAPAATVSTAVHGGHDQLAPPLLPAIPSEPSALAEVHDVGQTSDLQAALLDADAARVKAALATASRQTVLDAMRQIGDRPDIWRCIARFAPALLMQLAGASVPQAASVLPALPSASNDAIGDVANDAASEAASTPSSGLAPSDPLLWQRCLTFLASKPFDIVAFRVALQAHTTSATPLAPSAPHTGLAPSIPTAHQLSTAAVASSAATPSSIYSSEHSSLQDQPDQHVPQHSPHAPHASPDTPTDDRVAAQTSQLRQALLDADAARLTSTLATASNQAVLAAMREIGARADVWHRIGHLAPALLMQLITTAVPRAAKLLFALQSSYSKALEAPATTEPAPNDPMVRQRCLTYLPSTPFNGNASGASGSGDDAVGGGSSNADAIGRGSSSADGDGANASDIDAPGANRFNASAFRADLLKTALTHATSTRAPDALQPRPVAAAATAPGPSTSPVKDHNETTSPDHAQAYGQLLPHAQPEPPRLATEAATTSLADTLWLKVSTMIAAQSDVATAAGQPSLLALAVQSRAAESPNRPAFLQAVLAVLREQALLDLDAIAEHVDSLDAAVMPDTATADPGSGSGSDHNAGTNATLRLIEQQLTASGSIDQRTMASILEAISTRANGSPDPAACLQGRLGEMLAARPAAPQARAIRHDQPANQAAISAPASESHRLATAIPASTAAPMPAALQQTTIAQAVGQAPASNDRTTTIAQPSSPSPSPMHGALPPAPALTSATSAGTSTLRKAHPAYSRRVPGGALAKALARHTPGLRAALNALLRQSGDIAGDVGNAGDDIAQLTPATIQDIVKLLAGTDLLTMTRYARDIGALAAEHLPHLQPMASTSLAFETARFDLDWFFIQGKRFVPDAYAHALAAWLGGDAAGAAPQLHQALHDRLGIPQPAADMARPVAGNPSSAAASGYDRQASATNQATPDIEIDALLVDNAGQVLIGPYMPRLFSMLGLIEAGRFKNAEAAERAVHLLQCVVGGPSDTPEALLGLNKILCGVSAGTAIAREITITAQERDTVDMMLRAIVEHWKKIGNTTPDGLRQSFLQRYGRMHLKDDAWYLNVDPGTFDMLLDSLPWSFSIIKHTWMERAVHVNWR